MDTSGVVKHHYRRRISNVIPTDNAIAKAPAHTDKVTDGHVAPRKAPESPEKTCQGPITSCGKAATGGTGKHDSHHALSKTDFAESFGNMIANQSSKKIVDIAIQKSAGNWLYRRALLDTESSRNYMSGDVHRALGIQMVPYRRASVVEPGEEEEVAPLGLAKAEWQLSTNKEKTYTTLFLIIESDDFDLSLGKPLISEHRLNEAVGSP
ncbi:hypothetical protein GP486_002435 [Trichoglossum hirsutum]|uniref:Uncharacterized protein n=1 Tax=Trichoglossum hirsutum TaxID=265104 RepID=A0A9P8RRQ9_9PEZI|nr:hypothetical protein GP486_002435 [Trichoglossum hirsutum]